MTRRHPSSRGLVSVLLLALATAFGAAGTAAVEVRWKVDFDGSRSAPVVADGMVYVGSFDGAVYAFEAQSGRRVWRFQTGEGLISGPVIIESRSRNLHEQLAQAKEEADRVRNVGKREISATPVVARGSVYIGSEDHSFYSLDAATGELKWSYPTGGGITRPAVLADGLVLFVSEDGAIYALDAESGSERWVLDTSPETDDSRGRMPHPPVLRGSTLFSTVWEGASRESRGILMALDAETGESRWRVAVEGGGVSKPTIVGDRVLFSVYRVGFGGAALVAVDSAEGTIDWRFDAPARFRNSPAVVARDSVVLATDEGVFGLDPEGGGEQWRFEAPVQSSTLVTDERSVFFLSATAARKSDAMRPLFAPAKRNTLHALDAATGKERWNLRSKDVIAPRLVADGRLYVTAAKSLRALDAATGREVWSRRLPTWVEAPPWAQGGMTLISTTTDLRMGMRPKRGGLLCLEAR